VIVGCAQLDVVRLEPKVNARHAAEAIAEAAERDAELLLFPEAFLSGYCAASAEEARSLALTPQRIAAPQQAIQDAVDRYRCAAIVGYTAIEDDKLFNQALILRPEMPPAHYKKTHLPRLGFDRFATAGSALPTFEMMGRSGETICLGVLICFDLRIPEASRVLALAGADLILLPTNWPDGAQAGRDIVARARAIENKVFLAACNRCGDEQGFEFIGGSQIIDPYGNYLAYLDQGEGLIFAEIDPKIARNKDNIIIPGEYETNTFSTRQPTLYEPLTKSP
jgi:predicted amidohydrolase